MQNITYEDFINNLEGGLKHPLPLNGQIELTYYCNLNCIHCYCRGCEGKSKELSTQRWKDIFDQIHKEGCFWLTFTGGEPLLRSDFQELYAYALKKGFLVTVLSNGTVLSSAQLEFFKRNMPLSFEISLYGTTREVYESVTQVSGSFQNLRKNIDRLLQIKMPVVLKTVGLKQNKGEILKVKALSEELLGKGKFKFDSFIHPRINGNTTPCAHRLLPEEIIEIVNSDSDMVAQREEELHLSSNLRPKEYLYQCDTWRNNFFINPYGRLQFCHLSQKYSHDLGKISFKHAFYEEFPMLLNEKFKSSSKCQSCDLRKYCYFCPARSFLETKNEEGPVEYYCKLARAYFKQEQLLKS